MAATYIEVDDEAVRAVLQRLVDLGADMSAVTRPISEMMMAAVETRFADESSPEGPWADLAPSTKKAREKRGKWPGMILQESGQMLSQIVPFFSEDEAGVGTNYHAPGSDYILAAIQHFGTGSAGRNHATTIPARPIFVLSDEDIQRIFDSASASLDQVIGG